MKVGLSDDVELYKRNIHRPKSSARAKSAKIPDSGAQIARKPTPVMDSTYLAKSRERR
jgi:hypothetical protein